MGTLEYLSSLRHLDAFLSSATSEELAAADKFVTSRPQFTVYTQLTDRFRTGPGTSLTSPTALASSQKKGLAWVIALARLEAGAIVATFSSHPAPFEIVSPTRYEMPAYKELLMDGAQTHFLGLENDANLAVVARKIPDTETLSYIRRLHLARSMLSAAARSNSQELSAEDWLQLQSQDRQLLLTQGRFSRRVNQYVASLNNTTTSKTVSEKQVSNLSTCQRLLEAEQRELAAGTARVQTFGTR